MSSAKGTPRRGIDSFLLGPQLPVTEGSKVVRLGISTHQILLCDFTVQSEYLAHANPSGRLYRFRAAEQPGLRVAAMVSSLGFKWAQSAALTLDWAYLLYWRCLQGVIPPAARGFRVATEAAI